MEIFEMLLKKMPDFGVMITCVWWIGNKIDKMTAMMLQQGRDLAVLMDRKGTHHD